MKANMEEEGNYRKGMNVRSAPSGVKQSSERHYWCTARAGQG